MKAFAKINVFLKIVGFRNTYHEIVSRFVLFKELYDEIFFVKEECEGFNVECQTSLQDSTIHKAFNLLCDIGFKGDMMSFFSHHKVVLKKNIPIGAGLGGGSSDAAVFLKMCNEELNLGIKKETMMQLSSKIGADVAFFSSEERSANVTGIGENVIPFDDSKIDIELKTPEIFCSTQDVYREYRANFSAKFDIDLAQKLLLQDSLQILRNYKNSDLNDLFNPCKKIYGINLKENEFLSGSGSSFFSLKEG